MQIQETDIDFLNTLDLFKNIDKKDLPEILTFLNATKNNYEKNSIIKPLWDSLDKAGIIAKGSIFVEFLSASGNEHKISALNTGNIFGLSFACSNLPNSSGETVEVIAQDDTEIIFLELSNILSNNNRTSKAINQMSLNLLKALANKNVTLNKKLEILSNYKIRDRVMLFLKSSSKGKTKFEIPFNREEMASFLGVERSALSRELSKMKTENLIDYDGNLFTIKDF